MNCETVREMLGSYLDGELPAPHRAELEQHVHSCADCTAELEAQRALWSDLNRLGSRADDQAPPELWASIKNRLDADGRPNRRSVITSVFRRPMAMAASLAVLIGMGIVAGFWLGPGAPAVQASTIDYSILLDGLAEDVDSAVQRFFDHYQAKPIAREAADDAAPALSFALPAELPGGYRIERTYRLKFGRDPGVAAMYRRDGELLVVFFHPPVDQENMGIHRQSDCHVGGRDGQKVETGPWRLIHFTDPTTCHCLLSRLDEGPELFEIMARIAPKFHEATRDPVTENRH